MKVSTVSIDIIHRQVPAFPVKDARVTLGGKSTQGVLRIKSDSGLEGNAFIGSQNADASSDIKAVWGFKSLIEGGDVAERETLWVKIMNQVGHGTPPSHAWSTVDVALWDLAGKEADMPVCNMLGKFRDGVSAYATHPPRDTTVQDVVTAQDKGFSAYKIHPGARSPSETVKLVEKTRKAAENIELMLDPNNGYDIHSALTVGRALDVNRFAWFEDPVPWNQWNAVSKLSKRLDTPLAMSDAPFFLLMEAARAMSEGTLQIVRGTARKLGITGLRKLCATAEAFGCKCEIGLAGNSLLNAANLHVICSISNCDFYEWWLPREIHSWGVTEDLSLSDGGILKLPSGPGLGMNLDEEWIKAHREVSI